MAEKVVLAYSGGIDTSAAIPWLKENYGMDVITLTIDVGNERDFTVIRDKALKVGAVKALVVDARKEFVEDYIWKALAAGALYESEYPLATALGRPLIAKLLVDVALAEGASAIAHGCTGKGNDQVRFDVATAALAPQLKVIAPAREWGMTRQQTIEYCKKYRIPLPVTARSPYSIDENLWGRSCECGVLEDPWTEPPADVFAWTREVKDTPEKPAYVTIGFRRGVPVTLNNRRLDGVAMVSALNEIAGAHGIGRIDHVENRLVGIKSREIYEAPAAVILLKAHAALEAMTLAKDQARFKARVAQEYADLIYNGLWFSAHKTDLDAYLKNSQKYVTGTVRLKLERGAFRVVGRKSPYSLYSHGLATYETGDKFDASAAVGFIKLWGLPVRTQARAQTLKTE
ncbi:argininosuccinate synthase [Dehalogenimonas alkenigignens]|uniref:Argininosuccinate synthase n=1 Tax=Dehalogenimonas alkenigignens TaxID=1217799 RepID=A0A0W0GK31_9CHLR|nr:argininosuccinate synthase [Dehalogenimonas alkenigignens]KTB48925.1 argininosuccinate synthase [Dehalogenimonas alkenigignens]PVV82749.1 argininosuccinate synthase [Dehalogenimonas alkenigignens]